MENWSICGLPSNDVECVYFLDVIYWTCCSFKVMVNRNSQSGEKKTFHWMASCMFQRDRRAHWECKMWKALCKRGQRGGRETEKKNQKNNTGLHLKEENGQWKKKNGEVWCQVHEITDTNLLNPVTHAHSHTHRSRTLSHHVQSWLILFTCQLCVSSSQLWTSKMQLMPACNFEVSMNKH